MFEDFSHSTVMLKPEGNGGRVIVKSDLKTKGPISCWKDDSSSLGRNSEPSTAIFFKEENFCTQIISQI